MHFKIILLNGKISVFKKQTRTFPYGLLFDVIRFTKTSFPDLKLVVSQDVKNLFKGISTKDNDYTLSLYPYDYQKDCVDILLKSSKGIVVVATAGGKSLIISYLIDIINKYVSDNKSLIIVPTKQLVQQFKGDMHGYGMKSHIGIVDADHKEFNNQTVISTWQSLQNQMDELNAFTTVIVDEVHTARADVLSEILRNCTNARFRYGVTGTLPMDRLEKLNVLSYLGPVFREYTGKVLADLGYVSKCVIKQLYINYVDTYTGDYNTVKSEVFFNQYRLGLINHIVESRNNSILILVDKVEKEGVPLYEWLSKTVKDKVVVFLSGKDKSDIRDEWRKAMNNEDNIICIATYQIFQQGVNIPSLRTIILASSTKSYIRVIQSLGRVLRKHVSKKLGGAEMYDICDNVKFLKKHAANRNRYYVKEKHEILEFVLNESDGVYEYEK